MTPLFPLALALPLAVVALGALGVLGVRARHQPALRPRFHEAGALLLLAGLVAGFFWRPLFTYGVSLPIGGGDLASFFYPLYSFIYRSIHAGQFPLWNPYVFAGMPLAADVQSGMFYPPNLLAWTILPSYGYSTLESLLILHYAWAALGMYWWLRDSRLLRPAAVAGAAAFAFCGFMTAHFGHMPMIFAASWLPWNLLLARRAALRPNALWVVPAGVALALTFLAGHPQTTLYEGLALGLYWLFLVAGRRPAADRAFAAGTDASPRLDPPPAAPAHPDPPPAAGGPAPVTRRARYTALLAPYRWLLGPAVRVLVVGAIAAGLSAIQFMPSQELAGQSLRANISYEEATQHAMQPVGLLNLILPRVYGANPANYWVPWQSTENWGYLGLIALLLAAGAVCLRRDRRLGFPVGLGVLALLGMLGPFSIVFSWLHGLVPGFDKFRAAGRLLLLLGLANGALAALGLDALLRLLPLAATTARAPRPAPDVPRPSALDWGAPLDDDPAGGMPGPAQVRRVRWWAAAVGGLALFAALVLVPVLTGVFLSGFSVERGQIVLNDVYSATLWLGLAAGLLVAALRGRLAGRTAALALAVLLVIDLFSPNSHFNPTSDNILTGYNQANAVAFLRDHTGAPTYYRTDSDTDVGQVWQPMISTLDGIPDAGGLYNPLELQRYATYWDLAKANRGTVLYDLLSIRYTLAISRALVADPKWTPAADGDNRVLVAENLHGDPRLFLVHAAAVEPDDSAALGKLLNGTVLGWHTIYLPAGAGRQSKTPSTLEAGNPGETATITSYTPNQVEADLDAHEAGWAVLADAWYPGWTATLDGAPVAVDRADTIFRAVAVEPGRHKLVFRFNWPGPLRLGLAGTAATAGLTTLGSLAFWVRRRRAGRAPGHNTA